jgi:hypothetical protein
MIQRLRAAVQARVDEAQDREGALRRIARTTLRKTGNNHGVHLACLASLFSRILGINVNSAQTLAAITSEFPQAIYYFRKRRAVQNLRLRVVSGVRVRTSLAKLCDIVQGEIEGVARPVMRHARANRSELEDNRIGVYRNSCNWGEYPPQHRVVFEDWATMRRQPGIIAKTHGMQLEAVRAILSHHRARAGVIY